MFLRDLGVIDVGELWDIVDAKAGNLMCGVRIVL